VKITASFDPVSRLEGHLGVEVEFDTLDGVQQVVDVRASGLLFRGFENILIGRDPRDAPLITQRICGVCPVAHGLAAVKALDAACGAIVPTNARIMRNLVHAANFIESHLLHFYLLTLPDFISGPAKPPWQADWSIDRRFDPHATQALMTGYLKALEIRRKAHEMGALFGGKMPHPAAYVPGGFTAMPRAERIRDFRGYVDELIAFIRERYLPDTELLAAKYGDYFAIGRGYANLLAFGAFDLDDVGLRRLFTGGHILEGSHDPEPIEAASITEHVTYSWYQAKTTGLNPAAGKTTAVDPASRTSAYSWLKAPRYAGKPYEVGPLARMWINGEYTNGISVMDRHLARAKEAMKIAQAARDWLAEVAPEGPVHHPPTLPPSAAGLGLTEAPRGALGHWLGIAGGVISQYQVITPTTWNASPRDDKGALGPLEEALLGTPVENPDEPVEVMRVIHSFDPCLDCAVH
jgi:hydrogenase large subunit